VKNRESLILASNLLFLLVIPLVILWPVTGSAIWGVLAFASLLLSASMAGMNASRRGKRRAAGGHEHGPGCDH